MGNRKQIKKPLPPFGGKGSDGSRVARREPKYDWRGRAGEVSNPLFRGFDNKDEEQTEQYDQPVLVRLNTRDEAELRDGFPKTQEELFDYHAVILDDVEAEFFSHDQMELLQEFVAERGGGFLMLGGKESFQQGSFHRTPIGHILPVYLDRLAQQETVTRAYLNLTREGWLQPWARLCDNEQDELQRLLEMPAFRVLNCVRAVKPGARVNPPLIGDGFSPYKWLFRSVLLLFLPLKRFSKSNSNRPIKAVP